MTRKPWFWALFALLAAAGAFYAITFYPLAYPIVNIDLKMDRQAALRQAALLAQQHHWGPDGYRAAASFELDDEVQNFVELEAGGREAFRQMVAQGRYAPYTWTVRHFKQNTVTATRISFTPNGRPYGFVEKIPESDPGAALMPDSARAIAERAARDWGVMLAEYQLVESSQEERPGGRIDHTFTYERPERIGEGRYRMAVVVSGGTVTKLSHFVKIPEAFTRRYQQMRSANTIIATAGSLVMALLYIVGGCIIGLFLLVKKRAVLWRQALSWGLFVGLLQGLSVINNLPLAWMRYDTAVAAQGFLAQQLLQALFAFLGDALLVALTFMAAEGLTRWAFPSQIQLWQLWRREAAASPQVAGRTVSGYLFVGLFLAYDVTVYLLFAKVFKWWYPSEALFEPNILATYLPWLSPIANSFHAGFFEECMFRAIPIAGAALIGKRYHNPKAWVIGAFVVQALIFGSAHATYPNQPAYARLVELIIPSIAFGLIYLNWGLLPGIIMHYIFDAVLMSIPLFVSAAPGIWLSRAMVIVLALVPLLIVLYHRWRAGSAAELPQQYYNAAWSPAPVTVAPAVAAERPIGEASRKRIPAAAIAALGIVGLVVWLMAKPFASDAPKLGIGRTAAEAAAKQELAQRDIALGPEWRTLSTVVAAPGIEDKFVWRTAGQRAYAALIGSYLAPPHWTVRYVRFTGDVNQRAEEYTVMIDGVGKAYRCVHELPEARPGQNLAQPQAKMLADSAVTSAFGLRAGSLKGISTVPQKLPARTDWTITYADTAGVKLPQGQARIDIDLAGGAIADASRYIHVPEQWERQERDRGNAAQIIAMASGLVLFLLALAAAVLAVIGWTKKEFSVATFITAAGVVLALRLADVVLRWPAAIARFETARPYGAQLFMFLGPQLIAALFAAAGLGLLAGFAHARLARRRAASFPLAGLAWGAVGAAVLGIVALLGSKYHPSWPGFDHAAALAPALAAAIGALNVFIVTGVMWLLLTALLDQLSGGWRRGTIIISAGLVLAGVVLMGSSAAVGIPVWLGGGLALGAYLLLGQLLVIRFDPSQVPVIAAALAVLSCVETLGANPYPGAAAGALLGILLIGIMAWYWHKQLNTQR